MLPLCSYVDTIRLRSTIPLLKEERQVQAPAGGTDMKKNTKKRRTIRRLLIATAFALLMIPASVSADVVGKKITQEYTPDKQNPLSKIEYTYRSDG